MKKTMIVAAAILGIGLGCYLTGCVNTKAPDNIVIGYGKTESGVPKTLEDQLLTLGQWRDKGIVTDREYKNIRARMIEADKKRSD